MPAVLGLRAICHAVDLHAQALATMGQLIAQAADARGREAAIAPSRPGRAAASPPRIMVRLTWVNAWPERRCEAVATAPATVGADHHG